MTTTIAKVKRLAIKTEDAYSFDRYSNWAACAKMLLARGMTEAQAEAVLRSKLARWAADGAKNQHYGKATSVDLARYLDKYPQQLADLFLEEGASS